jgi:hypothetical protein
MIRFLGGGGDLGPVLSRGGGGFLCPGLLGTGGGFLCLGRLGDKADFSCASCLPAFRHTVPMLSPGGMQAEPNTDTDPTPKNHILRGRFGGLDAQEKGEELWESGLIQVNRQ